jgi:Tfp pilus assembly PilM family ATPase
VASQNVVIREIMIPFLQEDQIRKVLRFEAEAHLHSHAIEDVVVDFVKVGEAKDQSKVLIFAAPKVKVRETLDALKVHGVDPMHLDLDLIALFNAAKATGAFEEHPNSIILDIGSATTLVLSVQDGELKSCRSIRTGSESLTQAISADLAVDTDSARSRMEEGDGRGRPDDLLQPLPLDPVDIPETEKTVDELESALVVKRQDDFLSRIYRETTRSMSLSGGDREVTAIYLTGAASLSGGIKERLESRFRKHVLPLRLLDENDRAVAAADYDLANASMGVALGCALKYLGYEGLSVEFRREELRYTRKFDLIKVTLATTVSLVFILLFLTWLNYTNERRQRRQEFINVLALLNSKFVETTRGEYTKILEARAERLPQEPDDIFRKFTAWNSQIRKMHRHITDGMGINVKGIPPVRSALSTWRDLFDRLEARREELGFMVINDFKINQKSISFDGLIGNRGNVDLVQSELKLLPYVEPTGITRDTVELDQKTGKFKFGFTVELKPTEPE